MEASSLLQPLRQAMRPSGELFRAFLAELLATALFVFLGCGSVAATGEFLVDDSASGITVDVARVLPIATTFGLAITVLAFGIGPISGGHINPGIVYWIAQGLGAIFGALLLWAALSQASWVPSPGVNIPGFRPGIDIVPAVGRPPFKLGANQLNPTLNTGNGFLLEIIGTAMLIATVHATAVDNRSLGPITQLAPIPIGVSIWIVHLALIPWTGCGINPARTFGPAFVNAFAGNDVWQGWWWIYYLGPMFGSIIATMITCALWGGRNPPGYNKPSIVKKVRNEELDATATDIDLDAITI